MKKYYSFFGFWLVNTAAIYVANMLDPFNFVLGTYRFSVLVSALLAGLAWTILLWIVDPLIRKLWDPSKKPMHEFLFYFGINFVSLWIVTRGGPVLGFGVTGFEALIVLAFVVNFVQWGAWVFLKKQKLVK